MWREEKGKRIRGGGKAISDLLEGGQAKLLYGEVQGGQQLAVYFKSGPICPKRVKQ